MSCLISETLAFILTVYQEYGIFDALQKQYLRSFIFAIYLVTTIFDNRSHASESLTTAAII
jgi:hypothetical protein